MLIYGVAITCAIIAAAVWSWKQGDDLSLSIGRVIQFLAVALIAAVMINLGAAGLTKQQSLETQPAVGAQSLYEAIWVVEIEEAYFMRLDDQEGVTTVKKDALRDVIYIKDFEDARLVSHVDTSDKWTWWGYNRTVPTEYTLYMPQSGIVEIQTEED